MIQVPCRLSYQGIRAFCFICQSKTLFLDGGTVGGILIMDNDTLYLRLSPSGKFILYRYIPLCNRGNALRYSLPAPAAGNGRFLSGRIS